MGKNRLTPYEVWDRAHEGPKVDVKQYDFKILPELVARKVKEHDIKISKDSLLSEDSSLADAIYRAGYEVLLENGVYFLETGRMVRISEDELKEGLEGAPREITVGEGKDAVRVMRRRVGELKKPVVGAGPFATPLSQDMFVKACQSYAQEETNQILHPGTLSRIDGHDAVPGSPYEIKAARLESILSREACALAGRPGMGYCAPGVPITVGGRLAAEDELRPSDIHIVSQLCELKVDSTALAAIADYTARGDNLQVEAMPIMGGLMGTVEQTAVLDVAAHLATFAVFSGSLHYDGTSHVRWGITSSRETMQVMGHAGTAIDRNTDLITENMIYTMAGPCTEMCFIELAAQAIVGSASGREMVSGAGAAKGVILDHVGGLIGRALGEVLTAASKISVREANEIANKLLNKYYNKEYCKAPPIGKRFQDCYDISTLKPTEEHLNVYKDAMREIAEIGLPLKI